MKTLEKQAFELYYKISFQLNQKNIFSVRLERLQKLKRLAFERYKRRVTRSWGL